MIRSDFDKRWENFRSKVLELAVSPEQINDMKMCWTAGMIEMYHYMTEDVSQLNDWAAQQAISAVGVTLRKVSDEIVKEGFELLEKANAQSQG